MRTAPRLLHLANSMTLKRAHPEGLVTGGVTKKPAVSDQACEASAAPLPGPHPVIHTYARLLPATLSARYKRFLGDVHLGSDVDTTVIHVPNTGPMAGLVERLPSPVLLSVSDNPKRKYEHTLEWMQPEVGAAWVGVHSAKANAMVARLLALDAIPELLPYSGVKAEVRYGAEKSRVDFVLERPAVAGAAAACYVEVKSVTLAEDAADGRRMALFPDTVSVRARRHVRELIAVVQAGGSAALVFLVQRGDCHAFAPCHAKDPEYGALLLAAAQAGVLLVAIACELDAGAGVVRSCGTLPVQLRYGLDDGR